MIEKAKCPHIGKVPPEKFQCGDCEDNADNCNCISCMSVFCQKCNDLIFLSCDEVREAWRLEHVEKSRMFHLDRDRPIRTWNPVGGCKHHCYKDGCWAARQAPRIPRYRDGFDHPKLFENELKKCFKEGVVVFVSSMGDLFGEWVPDEWIGRVLMAMRRSPDATFLLETKNPARYRHFLRPGPALIPKNTILSTTIESNRDYGESAAPPPNERYMAMRDIEWPRKHISIEPIMRFNFEILVAWIQAIKPMLVSVGYDNYNCDLREPSLLSTQWLIKALGKFTKVETKTLREGRKQ